MPSSGAGIGVVVVRRASRIERLLGGPAAVDRRLADAGPLGQEVHRQPGDADLGEQLERRRSGSPRRRRPAAAGRAWRRPASTTAAATAARPASARRRRATATADGVGVASSATSTASGSWARAGRNRHATNAAPRTTTALEAQAVAEGVDEAVLDRRRRTPPAWRRGRRRPRARRRASRGPSVESPPVRPKRPARSLMCAGVDARHDAADDRHAEGAADLAGRVVDGRADAGLLPRQRAHHRLGGRRHRHAHADGHQAEQADRPAGTASSPR